MTQERDRKNYNWPKIAEEELAKSEDPREDDLKYLARDFARKYKMPEENALIYLEKAFLKRNNKSEANKKNTELLDDAYTYAIKLIQQKGTEDLVNTQLELFYWSEHKGLTLNDSYDIIHKAKEEFEQAITEEPEFKTGQELISEKESEIATSIETQVESQDEIEPRLYSFALNFLFNFQDPGKKILRSKLITAMNDYIEHFSLKYSAVQKLADEAIAEFREKSKTKPEFKTAYQELSSEKRLSFSSSSTVQDESQKEIEKESKILKEVLEKKKMALSQTENGIGSIPKMGISREFLPEETIKLQPRDEKILIALHYNSVTKIAQKNVERQFFISRSAFYRRIKKLESWGLIHRNPNTPISEFLIDPSFQEASPIFLSLSQGSSPTPVLFSPDREKLREKNKTLPRGTTSKKSKIDENHIFILKNIRHVEYPALLIDSFIQKTKKSRTTFFRKVNQLERWGLIVHVDKGTPRHYRLHPKLLNSSLKFLVVDEGTSPTFESTSQTAPIDEKPALDQFSKSHSKSHFEEIPKSTSKTAPNGEPGQKSEDSKSHSKSHFEEIPKSTSKTPSFEELVANFDPHNIRTHDYLYICKIKRASDNFRQQLAACNWLESKEGMNSWTWYRGSEKLHNIQCHYHIYTKKVTIQLLEVSSPDPFANNAIADDIAVQMTAYLEDQFLGLVLYDLKRRSRLEVKKLHHAIPNHPIAIRAFELNYTSTGTRFGVDDSKGNRELEAHNHKYSTDDIDNYVEDCDFKAETDYWFRDSARDIQQNGRTLQTITKIKEKIVDKIIQSLTRNGQSIQTIIQKIDHYSDEIQSIKQSAFTDQQFQNNLLSAIDHLGSFLTDIKQEQSETNLILSRDERGLKDIVDQKIKELISSIQSRSKLPRLQQLILTDLMLDKSQFLKDRLQEIISKNPGLNRFQISKSFGIKRGSVNGTVVRLKRRGLIKVIRIGRERGKIFLI